MFHALVLALPLGILAQDPARDSIRESHPRLTRLVTLDSYHPFTPPEDARAWSERRAYDRTTEVSVYVHREHRRRKVGRTLLAELVGRARNAGLRVLLARIAEGNEGSTRLFRAAGFKSVGTMRRVGEKHGRVLDVELMEFHLEE